MLYVFGDVGVEVRGDRYRLVPEHLGDDLHRYSSPQEHGSEGMTETVKRDRYVEANHLPRKDTREPIRSPRQTGERFREDEPFGVVAGQPQFDRVLPGTVRRRRVDGFGVQWNLTPTLPRLRVLERALAVLELPKRTTDADDTLIVVYVFPRQPEQFAAAKTREQREVNHLAKLRIAQPGNQRGALILFEPFDVGRPFDGASTESESHGLREIIFERTACLSIVLSVTKIW